MKTLMNILILLVLCCFAGCRKDPEPETKGPLLIPQEVKDYSQFKPGTYWVYTDSVSGRIDSINVVYLKTGFDTLSIYDSPKRAYEWFETGTHSEMDGYDYYFYCSMSYSYFDNSKAVLFVSKSKPGHYAGKTELYIYKPYKGQIIYDGNATKIINDVYNVLILNGIAYKNVIDFTQDKSAIDVSPNIRKFIGSNYGVIRKEYLDSNQVWNLARSNIIQ